MISLESLKKMTDLEGITEKHSDKLLNFRILLNSKLHQREMIKLENKIGIRCLRG